MKLSEALRAGRRLDLAGMSLHRYGYDGSLEDAETLAAWLENHPLIDIELPEPRVADTPVRPEQTAFRQRLMKAYDARCALTGCEVEVLLEAAHLRSWRDGNGVGDGILLRVDLHRLFDAGLMRVRPDYTVVMAPHLGEEYAALNGRKIELPKLRQDWPRL